VAVNRDGAVENRAGTAPNTDVRAAVPHNALTGREGSAPMAGWRARSHDSQRYHQPSAFGLRNRIRNRNDAALAGQ